MEEEKKPRVRKVKTLNPTSKDFEKPSVLAIPKVNSIDTEEDIPTEARNIKPKESRFEPEHHFFKLPSGRKILTSHLTEKGEIAVRRMTTVEEGFIKNIYTEADLLKVINNVLEKCIKTNIDHEELPLIDKIPLFLFIIALTYGAKHTTKLQCEECSSEQEKEIDLIKDIVIKYLPKNYEYPRPVMIGSYKGVTVTVWFRGPLIADEEMLFDENTTINDQMRQFAERIEGFDEEGTPLANDNETHANIINNLEHEDRQKFRKFLLDFTSHGSDLMIPKFICKNKKCKLHGSEASVPLPLSEIFMQIFFLNT